MINIRFRSFHVSSSISYCILGISISEKKCHWGCSRITTCASPSLVAGLFHSLLTGNTLAKPDNQKLGVKEQKRLNQKKKRQTIQKSNLLGKLNLSRIQINLNLHLSVTLWRPAWVPRNSHWDPFTFVTFSPSIKFYINILRKQKTS